MKTIVAISIDKVQTFLYHAIYDNKQEHQTNSGTLQSVVGASRQISDQFYDEIGLHREGGSFYGSDVLLQCSGMCIFATSLEPDKIRAKLKKLFEKYYEEFAGQLRLRYVFFDAPVSNDGERIAAVSKGKQQLKERSCLNGVLKENQDVIFSFAKLRKNRWEALEKRYQFVENINQLHPADKTAEDSFRIAVIKADLDGMGAFFNKIEDYTCYSKVSDTLNRLISLESLSEQVRREKEHNSDFKLFPLYIAGDDIFFAVPVADLVSGIYICTRLLEDINKQIKDELLKNGSSALSLSIGVEIIFNREPIRYYYERVETQLQEAKNTQKPDELKTIQCSRICINHSVYFQYRNNDIGKGVKSLNSNKEIQQWSHLMSGVKLLHKLIKEEKQRGATRHHFLYGLLQKLTDPELKDDEIKRSNSILYHMLPQYIENSNAALRGNELLFIEKLLEKVAVTTNGSAVLCFGEEQCRRLEKYVRLLLLFTDGRFNIRNDGDLPDDATKKRVRSHVFNRALRYLYEQSLHELLLKDEEKNSGRNHQIKRLRNVFVSVCTYSAGTEQSVKVYQRLPVSASVFYRLKQKAEVKDSSEVIAAMDSRTKAEYENSKKDWEKEKKTPPPLKWFPKKDFINAANASGVWKNDYIDSLLLFYRFDDALIRYRTIYSTKKLDNKRKGKT